MAKFEFRGFAELWSCSFHANASWFGAGCSISAEAISVRALGHEHIHRRVELLAVRWIWLPLPRFIVISQTGGAHRYSVFQTLRWSRLRAALHSCGYAFTEESRYYSWQRVRDDVHASICSMAGRHEWWANRRAVVSQSSGSGVDED
jgi:hypothetical protein